MKHILFFFLFITSCNLSGQKVTLNEPVEISRLMNRYVQKNLQETEIRGWRIQIISTSDRREMEQTKNKFDQLYPEIESNWNHVVPYYQVRIGAYEDKTTLMAFLMEIKEEFPTATPVVDNIEKTELLK
jgi:hypothetical protein